MKPIYLDHAAATPIDAEVLAAMQPFFAEDFYNPSATYLAGQAVRRSLESSRYRVAKALGAHNSEVIFTAGATEANNLAIHGVMSKFPTAKVLVSAIEHDSVLEPTRQHNHGIIPVDKDGHVDQQKLRTMLAEDVVLVSIMYANNEVGTIQHMSAISKLIRKERGRRKQENISLPLYLHTDAAQAPNYLHVLPKRLGVQLMSLNGGKIYGPKQSGALFVAAGTQIEPIIRGGGQEFGLRSGTENVAGIVGFSLALEKAAKMRVSEAGRLIELKSLFVRELLARKPNGPHMRFNDLVNNLHNIVHVVIPGIDNERVMMELDERGVQCAVGSACSASNDEPSHVLKAIGLSDQDARASLRFSMGRQTTEQDIRQTVNHLADLIE